MAAPKQTDPQFKLRLPASLKEQIEVAADKNNRSMNSEIVARLQASFNLPHQNGDGTFYTPNWLIEKLISALEEQRDKKGSDEND
ncbi:Arc family DNA-binding protein [Limimaricola sp.]|uniref:Arc family DNA-binding protein n=1 Tax=Limimaricola sp. TaxID=2211665 RepID=UPI004058C8CF